MSRHHYPVHAYRIPHAVPKTAQEVIENRKPPRLEKFEAFARGNSIDVVLHKAKVALEEKGYVIRSLSMGFDKIVAYVIDAPTGETTPRKPLSEKRRRAQYPTAGRK